MSIKKIVLRIFLSLILGGHAILGIGMSRKEIEWLLSSMNRTHVETTVADSKKIDEIPPSCETA